MQKNESLVPTSFGHESLQPSIDPLLLTAQQVADLLQISPRTLWRYVSSSQIIRPVKIGGATRWRRVAVQQWIDAGCPPPTENEHKRRR